MKTNLLIGTLCTSLAILDLSNYMSRLNEIEVSMLRDTADSMTAWSYELHPTVQAQTQDVGKDMAYYIKTRDNQNFTDRKTGYKHHFTLEEVQDNGNFVLPWVRSRAEQRSYPFYIYVCSNERGSPIEKAVGLRNAARNLERVSYDHAANPKDLWQGLVFAGFAAYGFWRYFRDKYLVKREV